jgi:hypothetical protein
MPMTIAGPHRKANFEIVRTVRALTRFLVNAPIFRCGEDPEPRLPTLRGDGYARAIEMRVIVERIMRQKTLATSYCREGRQSEKPTGPWRRSTTCIGK